MAIYDFFLSRNGAASTPENYVGHTGRLFYDSATGEIRISDGTTPGGLPIPVTIATSTTAGSVKPGPGFTVDAGGLLSLNAGSMFTLDVSDVFQLLPGTSDRIGGVKSGSGVVINTDGTILIDSTGLEFTFGDFSGTVGTYSDSTNYALLQSLNANEDIVIATNGTGHVNMVGEFNVYATNADVTDAIESYEPILRVLANGRVRMLVPAANTNTGAFEIIGNATGYSHPTNQTGVVLHTTGQINTVSRVYHDAVNNYPIIVGRRYNGVAGALENVKAGDVIFRIAGQASTGTDFETFGPAKINWMATEDQTPTAQGGKITFDVTANGTAAFGNAITVAEFTSGGLVSAVGFVGNLTGNVSGNASTVTNGVYTTDTGTVTNTMLANSSITVNGTSIALGASGTVTAAAGTLTGTTLNSTVVSSSLTSVGTLTGLTVTGTVAATNITGKYIRTYRAAGVIADGGTVTINFATDSVVYCQWDNNFTVAYSNFSAGSVVKLIAFKRTGTGTDSYSLGGITAGQVSTGSTSVSSVAGVSNFVEFTCTGTTVGTVFAKI